MVYVLSRGWHTEIGLDTTRLDGPLAAFGTIFPGARAVMFGYGKRTFMTAPADDISEYLLGPLPGPGVIEAIGINAAPPDAYGAWNMVALTLPPGGAQKLSAFIWNDLAHDRTGGPLLLGPGPFVGSLFYVSRSRYTLLHTCNTWVADALHAAGLPVSGTWDVLSGQTMFRAARAASAQCRAAL